MHLKGSRHAPTSLGVVVFPFDPGALLGRFYPLEDGSSVSLRVVRSSDAAQIRELFERRAQADGVAPQPLVDLAPARLVSFDPRRRCVLAATALIDGGERLVGVGSIGLDEVTEAEPRPEVVVVDPDANGGVAQLLSAALTGRAEALARDRAA